MLCPHGRETALQKIFGVSLFVHDNGAGCGLLNRLDVRCGELSMAFMARAMREPLSDDHVLRFAHAAYKASPSIRFAYLEHLSRQDPDGFARGFGPVALAMAGKDEAATEGLYLIEIYFAFAGITSRINSVNERLTATPIHRFLGGAGVTRVLARENDATRTHVRMLESKFARYRNSLRVPGES